MPLVVEQVVVTGSPQYPTLHEYLTTAGPVVELVAPGVTTTQDAPTTTGGAHATHWNPVGLGETTGGTSV